MKISLIILCLLALVSCNQDNGSTTPTTILVATKEITLAAGSSSLALSTRCVLLYNISSIDRKVSLGSKFDLINYETRTPTVEELKILLVLNNWLIPDYISTKAELSKYAAEHLGADINLDSPRSFFNLKSQSTSKVFKVMCQESTLDDILSEFQKNGILKPSNEL